MCHAGGVGRRRAQGDAEDLVGVIVFNGNIFRSGGIVAVDFDRAIELGDVLFSNECKIIFHKVGKNTQGAMRRQCYSVLGGGLEIFVEVSFQRRVYTRNSTAV